MLSSVIGGWPYQLGALVARVVDSTFDRPDLEPIVAYLHSALDELEIAMGLAITRVKGKAQQQGKRRSASH